MNFADFRPSTRGEPQFLGAGRLARFFTGACDLAGGSSP